jgi:hypothetical protein
MSQWSDAADDAGIVSPDRVRSRVQSLLRAAQAQGWTDDTLEAATGVKSRRIKSYRVEGKEPSLSAALSIAVVLGPQALNPLLALIGYVARPLDEADEITPARIVADGLVHFQVIAAAAADGRIDHTEAPACQRAADQLIATVLPLASAGKPE